MNNKGQSYRTIIGLIFAGAFLVIVSVFIVPNFLEASSQSFQDTQCGVSLIIPAYAKKLSGGFTQVFGDIPPKCKMNTITITRDYIDQRSFFAEEKFEEKPPDLERHQVPNDLYQGGPESLVYEDTVKRIIAEEMMSCVKKTWKGKVDVQGANLADVSKAILSQKLDDRFCLICSRILFDENVKNLFGVEGYYFKTPRGDMPVAFKMKEWLQTNTVGGQTYYDAVTEGAAPVSKQVLDMAFFPPEGSLAVVFVGAMEKESGTFEVTSSGGVGLFEYGTLTKDLGYVVTETTTLGTQEVRPKCTTLIGS